MEPKGLTLERLRFEILESINMYSDDSTITYRLLDQWIQEYRVKWIELEFNKFNRIVPMAYYQNLNCLELEAVDIAECCSTLVGCEILRTKREIPSLVSLTDGELIAKVSPVGVYAIPFQLIKYENLEWFGNGRYEKKRVGTFYYNNRMYFYCKDKFTYSMIEKVSLRAVFRYPKEVGEFTDCSNQPCWGPNSQFPLDEKMWSYIKKDILVNELNIKLATPEDNTLDNAKTGFSIRQDEGNK